MRSDVFYTRAVMEFTPGVYGFQDFFFAPEPFALSARNNIKEKDCKKKSRTEYERSKFFLSMHAWISGGSNIVLPLQNSDQGGSDKVLPLPLQNPYPGKSRGFGIPVLGAPLDPPMLSTILFLVFILPIPGN